jgi:cellulose synthase/poly-beta-1,6-N-acetylglucosamine synthase-like glycosyltransferase
LLFGAVGVTTIFYFALLLFKSQIAWHSVTGGTLDVTRRDLRSLGDSELPIVTILVPLYHEGAILHDLVRHLEKLIYPPSKLEILLLLEADDHETQQALANLHIPSHFHPLIAPVSALRTKPRVCNIGLAAAHGEYCVIYDAEDMPAPDQILKAIAGFKKAGPEVGCLQARLRFSNHRQNFLTRFFAAEYAMYFNLVLPGLGKLNLPTPLGGTSNFFRTVTLREGGGWDPYNVTEDLDLGICLARAHKRVVTFNSDTEEIATWLPDRWIRQRTRWIKGHIQTYFVHMRSPIRLWKDLGPLGFFSFQLIVGGTPLVLFINPIFWTLTVLYAFTGSQFITSLYPNPLYWLGVTSMIVGNFLFLWLFMAGCIQQGLYRNIKWMLLAPFYWVLMSVAAWRAVLQFVHRPHHWEKTNHAGNRWILKHPAAPQPFEVEL